MSIKIISLNVERNLHYDRVFPFLLAEQPDVVCLQEVLDEDLSRFEQTLGMPSLYASTAYADRGRQTDELIERGVQNGNAILTRLPKGEEGSFYYYGSKERIASKNDVLPPGRHDPSYGVFLWVRVTEGTTSYTIGTTHFTWTPDGRPSPAQREDMEKMLLGLKQFPDIVFCGDFNAPRGWETWEALASRYRDNIPPHYATSIDQELHAVKGIQHVVDGLFSTPEYEVRDVRLVSGISDHMAILGTIDRKP